MMNGRSDKANTHSKHSERGLVQTSDGRMLPGGGGRGPEDSGSVEACSSHEGAAISDPAARQGAGDRTRGTPAAGGVPWLQRG